MGLMKTMTHPIKKPLKKHLEEITDLPKKTIKRSLPISEPLSFM